MKSTIVLGVFLLLTLVSECECTVHIHLDVSSKLPTHIDEDISLSLTCNLFSNDSYDEIHSVLDITIHEIDGDNKTKLAEINAHADNILVFGNNESTNVEGKLYQTNGYLKIATTADDAINRNFSCAVTYYDKIFDIKTRVAYRMIKGNGIFTLLNEKFSANQESVSQLKSNLSDLEIRFTALERQLMHVTRKLSKIDNSLLALDNTMNKLLNVTEENRKKLGQSQNQTGFTTRCNELTKFTAETWPRQFIKLANGTTYLCDTSTDGGGWTVFQRWFNGRQDFYQNWTMYESGFGSIHGDFWLGLKTIRNLVKDKPHELRVDLVYKGKAYYAHYKSFEILDASTNYRLLVSAYDGNAGDDFSYHSNKSFTTFDRDNDLSSSNCAVSFVGAWWYGNCFKSNLNGMWNSKDYGQGVNWETVTAFDDSATFTEMKMRQINQ